MHGIIFFRCYIEQQRDFSAESREMKSILRLTDLAVDEIYEIFHMTDEIKAGKYANALSGKTILLFFPDRSIRTRVTFEKGIELLGGKSISFSPSVLDKRENIRDVVKYLENWIDAAIVRYPDISMLEKMRKYSEMPIINAMTDENHPCEILTDLYSLSKIRKDFRKEKYLFCGANGNIGLGWKEAAVTMELDLSQCCPNGYEMEGISVYHNIREAVKGKDIICTDSIPADARADFRNFQITEEIMNGANSGAVLNPCPPFYCGEEVSEDVIASAYFAGYEFKKSLLEVQQAVILYCLTR